MPWPASIASLFRRSTRRPSSNYWLTVPVHRLTYLLLAIFCMFGMVGCFVDLLALGEHPRPFVMVWTIFSGAIAAAAILTGFRAPRRLWIVVLTWIAGSRLLDTAMQHFPFEITHPSMEHGVRTATVACIILSIGACIFFLQFIQNEGRHAVRMQTELALAQGIQQTLVPIVDVRSPAPRSMASHCPAPRSVATWSMSYLCRTARSSPMLPMFPDTDCPREFSWA
jgi:hypothetical protein